MVCEEGEDESFGLGRVSSGLSRKWILLLMIDQLVSYSSVCWEGKNQTVWAWQYGE